MSVAPPGGGKGGGGGPGLPPRPAPGSPVQSGELPGGVGPGGHLRASPQLLRQLTSPTVGGPSTGLANHALEAMLPRSPLPPSQASYHTPSPLSPYRSSSPTTYPGSSPSKLPRPPLGSRPASQRSPATSPARKRLKLDLSAATANPSTLKRKLFEWRTARLRRTTSAYRDNMAELFFLKNGTNVTDNLVLFRKKPNQTFVNFLKASGAPPRVISEVQTAVLGQANSSLVPPSASPSHAPLASRRPPFSYSPRTVGLLSPVKVGEQQDVFNQRLAASRPAQSPTASSIPPPCAPLFSRDQVTERMKQEGWVSRRVAELARDGLWPAKRLPKVAERQRPMSAWDLVLEEMKWLAADFRQERLWKQAAARLQSAAVREQVIQRQREQEAIAEESSEQHRRGLAKVMAGKVDRFWGEVESLQQFELVKRRQIHCEECLIQQAGVVQIDSDESLSVPGVKRKLSQITGGPTGSIKPKKASIAYDGQENGVTVSDCESSVLEQEEWEVTHWVTDDEILELQADSNDPLEQVLRDSYPGFQEDLRDRLEDSSDEEDCLSDWETDSDCESEVFVNIDCLLTEGERTKREGLDLSELSSKAGSILPKSVITPQAPGRAVLKEHQQTAVDWLLALYRHHLPAILADEAGLGRKVTLATFLSEITLQEGGDGPPHLLVCPMSSISGWGAVLGSWVPSLSLSIYSGTASARRRLREEISLRNRPPRVVITSYRTLFHDSGWFLARPWAVLVQAESHNVISAGSADQIKTLARLRTNRRVLLCSKPQKENPIDLWNTLYLLFPSALQQRESVIEAVEVEGTAEYKETVGKLQKILSSFISTRGRAKNPFSPESVIENKVWVNLKQKQRKLYDDFLAQDSSQECIQRGDMLSVTGLIQSLRHICNPPLSDTDPEWTQVQPPSPQLPPWCFLDREPPRPFRAPVVRYDPLSNISLDQVNLVFLSQELTTTVLTSSRLRSLKASRRLISELAAQPSTPPEVPSGRLHFSLEGVTRGLGGWAVGSLADGVSLVRTASGQVYKVSSSSRDTSGDKSTHAEVTRNLGALHPQSLETIAAVNHWRCDGFPLYGQDLIRSLSIMGSLRPVKSRFRGQGYVNCLNTEEHTSPLVSVKELDRGRESSQEGDKWRYSSREADRWRYTSPVLSTICSVATRGADSLMSCARPKGQTCYGNKMQVLKKLLASLKKRGKFVVVVRTEQALESVTQLSLNLNIRSAVVRGSDSLSCQLAQVEGWRLEPRLTLLLLAGLSDTQGTGRLLDLTPANNVVLLESGPGLWEPYLEGSAGLTVHRLVTRGTVEEGLGRVSTVRKVLADIDTSNSDSSSVSLSRPTLQEVLLPQPDNGYIGWHNSKKKEKGLSDSECISSLSAVWTYLAGGHALPPALLDLAELETMESPRPDRPHTQTVLLRRWLEKISPVARYGMRLLRDRWEVREGLPRSSSPAKPVESCKRDWERRRLKEEQRRQEEDRDEQLVTYNSQLAVREWRAEDGLLAPVYKPPGLCDEMVSSPVSGGLYSRDTIPEKDLPPVHIKKEKKTLPQPVLGVICQQMSPPTTTLTNQLSPASGLDLKPKLKREPDQLLTSAPRSLFDRPKPLKAVPRRPPGLPGGPQVPPVSGAPQATPGPSVATKPATCLREGDAGPEWTIQEDWALHQAVMAVQELPLSLSSVSPGHITNWDMVSDMVNAVSRCFRSGKHCRARYESTVVPREEGRIMYDVTPKKVKKATKIGQKGDKKVGTSTLPTRQAMKTGALLKADNNNAFSNLFSSRFETIKTIANKRTPTTKPLLVNPTMRNPKHAAVLAESGISYDAPLTPVQVAANRAERIQREKQRTAQQAQLPTQTVTAASPPVLPSTPLAQQTNPAGVTRAAVPTAPLSGLSPTVTAVNLPTTPAQAVVVGISQPLQQVAGQQATVQNVVSGNLTRPVTALSVQDILKGTVTTTVVTGTGQAGSSLASAARLAGGQIVHMSQAAKSGGASPTVQVAGRQLTQQQLQVLKQQAILKKNQQEQQQQKHRLAMAGGNSVTQHQVASTSKVSVASAALGATVGRGQVVKQNVRSMTEPEMKALLAKQQLKVGSSGVVQVPAGTSLSSAQLQQLGLQVANPSSSAATIVKTITTSTQAGQAGTSKSVTIAGVTGAVNLGTGQLKAVAGRGTPISGSPQQLQQVQIQRHLQLVPKKNVGGGQRVALQQVTGSKGLPAQLIVQPGGKGLPATVTVQQLQQIVKSVATGGQGQVVGTVTGAQGQQQIISHAVLAKPGAPGQTVQARVIPVSATGARQGQQTIQVVAAAPGQRSAPNVTIDQLGRPQTIASALAAGNHVKIQAPTGASQQLISQVSAALAGHNQNVSVAVRAPASSGGVPQGATVLQQSHGQPSLTRVQQPQMVNLQLSVAQPHTTQTTSTSQPTNNTE